MGEKMWESTRRIREMYPKPRPRKCFYHSSNAAYILALFYTEKYFKLLYKKGFDSDSSA